MIQTTETAAPVVPLAETTIQALMIDDDEMSGRLVKGALKRHGCDVEVVTSPVKALEVFTRRREQIQLVLLDYFMPTMDGGKTLEWLRKMNPQIRVILCSGSEELRLRQLMTQLPFDGVIHKPLRLEEALSTIRDVMSKPARSA